MPKLNDLRKRIPKKIRDYIYGRTNFSKDRFLYELQDISAEILDYPNKLICVSDHDDTCYLIYRQPGRLKGNYTVINKDFRKTYVSRLTEIKKMTKGMKVYYANAPDRIYNKRPRKKIFYGDAIRAIDHKNEKIIKTDVFLKYWDRINNTHVREYIKQTIDKIYKIIPDLKNNHDVNGEHLLYPYEYKTKGQRHVAIDIIDELETLLNEPYSTDDVQYVNPKEVGMSIRHHIGKIPYEITKSKLKIVTGMKHKNTMRMLKEKPDNELQL